MKTIKAVEMTRSIRDTIYEQTKQMTAKQWLNFIRTQAKKMDTELQNRKTKLSSVEVIL
jgi:hypothetical protein